jgi:3D (Asp-Asp-Asp) domain-containing protein
VSKIKKGLILLFFLFLASVTIAHIYLTDLSKVLTSLQHENKQLNSQILDVTERLNALEQNNKELVQEIEKSPSRGGPRSFVATAYSHTGNPTYSGRWPQLRRTIAADPHFLPIGTLVEIETDYPNVSGIYIVEDTGGNIKGHRIDIFMNRDEAILFGRREVKITVIGRLF